MNTVNNKVENQQKAVVNGQKKLARALGSGRGRMTSHQNFGASHDPVKPKLVNKED